MPIQVEELAAGFNPDKVRMLVYGESGAGKTRFACTFPNPVVIDIDHGLASVDWEISKIHISSWQDLVEAYQYVAYQTHPFETVILDTLNEAQFIAMQSVIKNFPQIRRAYQDLAAMGDYGKMLSDFDKMVRAFRALPMHVVLVSQVTSKEFDEDMVMPQLTGKQTSRNICRQMDVIGYLYRDEEHHPVMGFGLMDYVSKDRSGKLPERVVNPTFETLYRYWTDQPVAEAA